jgi:hypothetical protein
MSSENKQEGRKSLATVSRVLPSGVLVELVYDASKGRTALAIGSPDGVSIEESMDLEGGARLIPWSAESNLIKRTVVLLPERPEEFGTIAELVAEIDAYLYCYVDLSDGFRKIAAYYILVPFSPPPSSPVGTQPAMQLLVVHRTNLVRPVSRPPSFLHFPAYFHSFVVWKTCLPGHVGVEVGT